MAASDRVRLVPSEGTGRPLGVAVLIAVIIAIGLLKPWGSGAGPPPPPVAGPGGAQPGGAPSSPMAARAADPALNPVPRPSPPTNISGPCYFGLAWRLFTAETTGVGPVHTWYDLQPFEASGPTDPRIRVVQVHSSAIRQLGFCPVTQPNGPIHVLGTDAWQLVPGAAPRPIGLPLAVGIGPADSDEGVVYLPPPAPNGFPVPVWAPSVYVFVVRLATEPVSEEWFAVDIT